MPEAVFPEFWNQVHWRVAKNREDLWLKLSSGEEKKIGSRTVYEREKDRKEKVLEINLFDRGAVGHIWFPDAVNAPGHIYSRLLKNGAWVYGLPGESIDLRGLRQVASNKFVGVRMSLKIAPEGIAEVDILKNQRR